jgi:hypothetical protein
MTIQDREEIRELILDYVIRPIFGIPRVRYQSRLELRVDLGESVPSYGSRSFQRDMAKLDGVLYVQIHTGSGKYLPAAYSKKTKKIYISPEVTGDSMYNYFCKTLIAMCMDEGIPIVEGAFMVESGHVIPERKKQPYGLGLV